MKILKASNTYAVVDLETTGTNLDGSQRIIQFACVLVEDGQIVNQFSTLINPLRPLSPEVEKLTGLKQKDLKKAPSFDEVAASIYALLQGTIFVAHNIQFDYRFLNLELERVGYPALELKGGYIDGKETSLEELKKLATIPSRDGLLTMFAAGLMEHVKNVAICLDLHSQNLEEK